ncbi:peptidoglycan-binding domain-containing protein [Streptomyces sp. NPDC023723]|uniref:efflux RND transporter periplasmic adaptor subunit n=1 Tax=Streptomyces sp. NPDC023723 TaxID=3154323 RepID=UPI0033EA3BBA
MSDAAVLEAGPPAASGAGPEAPPPRRRRTRWLVAALGVLAAVGGAAAAGAAGVGLGDGGSDGSAQRRLPPATADVTRQTLTDGVTEDGELGYGSSSTVTGHSPGTVTDLPTTGDRVTRGEALYRVDERPVVLMYGSAPAYRALRAGLEGDDVRQLERNLDALGYTGFSVDDEYTDATADAVSAWQRDAGLEETGVVDNGQVRFAPGAVRVDALQAEEGGSTGPGQKVLTYTSTAQSVSVELDTADLRLAEKGAKVSVVLPDGTEVGGRITEVATEISAGEGEEDDTTTVGKVAVALDGDQARKAAAPYVLASVDVTFTAGRRENVLTVPVAALVALPEGGFAVEAVKGSSASYVPVETGLFADGRVEISGDGVTEGMTVGMP